ncbi:MAG: LD-carboxypeptidase [Chitinophagaceae bacterium]|jgi:muramoyltetrapeptide carboxypeptidase|nr:LD-carboxypeptidase [Chitinophagaceae bacterium]
MKRRSFLAGASAIAGGLAIPSAAVSAGSAAYPESVVPQPLKQGDTIAITCPAGFINFEDIQPAVRIMERWGFKIRLGNTVGKRDFSFGGTDAERARDMQILMDDPSVKAIMCARGGYGVSRILDQLSFTRMKEKPKWIIGFSDITALHVHIARMAPTVSIHSKMCNSFPDDWETAEPIVQETILSIKQAITGTKMKYQASPDDHNRTGVGDGILIGGNLSIINHLMGTASEINTNGRILFLEETGEYLYSLDRMFVNLRRSGKLAKLAGLIIGGFKIKPDDPGEEFGRTLYDIVREKTEGYTYPVCFNFPVGHQKNNVALKCGARHLLTVRTDAVELVEK